MAYGTTDEILDRLSEQAGAWVSSQDAGQLIKALAKAGAYADGVIDAAVMVHAPPGIARASGSTYLNALWVKIGTWDAAGFGGSDRSTAIIDDFNAAMAEVADIKDGKPIPGVVIPTPVNSPDGVSTLPVVVNPCGFGGPDVHALDFIRRGLGG